MKLYYIVDPKTMHFLCDDRYPATWTPRRQAALKVTKRKFNQMRKLWPYLDDCYLDSHFTVGLMHFISLFALTEAAAYFMGGFKNVYGLVRGVLATRRIYEDPR